ncbi:MAG: hypothetical protein M3Y57_02875 [Acidobacteriota bacterium]|nr:hypothetical protein [Acidobacteriota bacterium]
MMVCMQQININVTPEFENDLQSYMRITGLKQKSEAIRLAVKKALEREAPSQQLDFREWLGLGLKAPMRKKRKFAGEDELWS